MGITDEDLWHRATTGDGHHVGTCVRVGVDANFFNVGHAFGVEQLLGTNAIGANGGGVHLDGGHDKFSEVMGATIKLWQLAG
jgi:hypothetical protein